MSSQSATVLTPCLGAVYYSITVSAFHVERPLSCFKVGPVVDEAVTGVLLGAFW